MYIRSFSSIESLDDHLAPTFSSNFLMKFCANDLLTHHITFFPLNNLILWSNYNGPVRVKVRQPVAIPHAPPSQERSARTGWGGGG